MRVSEIEPGMVETDFSMVRFDGDEDRAAKVYEGVEALTAEDVAECITFVATRPSHVNIDQLVVLARDQLGATQINRRPTVTEPVFTGVGVALATLFDADLAVDVDATRDHAVRLVEVGDASRDRGRQHRRGIGPRPGRAPGAHRRRRSRPSTVPVIAGTGRRRPSRQAVTLSLRRPARPAADAAARPLTAGRPPTRSPTTPPCGPPSPTPPLLAYHYPNVSAPGIAVDALPGLPDRRLQGLLRRREPPPGHPRDRSTAPLYTRLVGGAVPRRPARAAPAPSCGLANVDPEGCIAAFAGDGAAQRALAPAHLAMGRAFPAEPEGVDGRPLGHGRAPPPALTPPNWRLIEAP